LTRGESKSKSKEEQLVFSGRESSVVGVLTRGGGRSRGASGVADGVNFRP